MISIPASLATAFLFSLAVAGVVHRVFYSLSFSQPLSNAALEWITNPWSTSALRRQFLQIRSQMFGSRPVSRKRFSAIALTFLLAFVPLLIAFFIPEEAPVPEIVHHATTYAFGYAVVWFATPAYALSLLALSFFICWLSFLAFDLLVNRLILLSNRIVLYVLLTIALYIAILALLFYISAFMMGAVFFSQLDFQIFVERGTRVNSEVLGQLRQWFRGTPDFKFGVEAVGVLGTTILWFSAILALTVINFLYGLSLLFVQIELFFRDKLKWRQSAIFTSPLDYLGYVAGSLAFFILFIPSVVWVVSMSAFAS